VRPLANRFTVDISFLAALTNEKGERITVVISIEEYEELIEKLEDAEDIRAIEEAKASGEVPIPLEEALTENRLNRK
jgi:hypothetical protein